MALKHDFNVQKNVGPTDRKIRLAVGVGLIALPLLTDTSPLAAAVLGAIGGTEIATGVSGY